MPCSVGNCAAARAQPAPIAAPFHLEVQLPAESSQNASSHHYRVRFWNHRYLHVGIAQLVPPNLLRVSASILDAGRYAMLVTRFNKVCVSCSRPPSFVHAANITVDGPSASLPSLAELPSCVGFVGSNGRWVRRSSLCATEDNRADAACSFAAVDSSDDAWLWLPFTCAYRLPTASNTHPYTRPRRNRDLTLFIFGDSTSRFLWGPFISLFEDDPAQQFHQRGYGTLESSRLGVWSNESDWQWPAANATHRVNQRCQWETNYYLWRRGGLSIGYGHPLWTCHNRVQCVMAKRCHLSPEQSRARYEALVRSVRIDYAVSMTADTAAETGCSPRTRENAQLQSVAALRAAQSGRVVVDRRSLIGFAPDNNGRLHCVNAAEAARTHAAFGTAPEPLFNGSIDLFTLSEALYHFTAADAELARQQGLEQPPAFPADGIHAAETVNKVLAGMLAAHVFGTVFPASASSPASSEMGRRRGGGGG